MEGARRRNNHGMRFGLNILRVGLQSIVKQNTRANQGFLYYIESSHAGFTVNPDLGPEQQDRDRSYIAFKIVAISREISFKTSVTIPAIPILD